MEKTKSLSAIYPKPKSGEEQFIFENQNYAKLQDFCCWGFSNLMDNALRGALAEFVVCLALEIKREGKVRNNWTAWDLETKSGLKIEVKSSAYFQWGHQEKTSKIIFDIASASG
jgi:hypothetical protein